MTDNRTNEPNQDETKSGQEFCFTEAQVEAAAKVLAPDGVFAKDFGEYSRKRDNYRREDQAEEQRYYMRKARAALVAAAGAAPQAESEHFHIWSELPCRPGACRMEPAPGEPSSTVDEDALAEVIREALRDDRLRVAYGAPVNKPQHVVVARAVAEWLKEQGL